MGRYYIHVTDGEHTIPDETGGEFASIHQVRQHVVETAKDLIQERLQDRSRWSACAFLIANDAGQSLLRIRSRRAWTAASSENPREPHP
jgi:hypothetical protein